LHHLVFKGLFKRKRSPEPARDDWQQKLVWLPAGHPENPFPAEVLDCRAVALTFFSTTSDSGVAESFGQLRASDGRELCGRTPDAAIHCECVLRYPSNGAQKDGPLSLARQMEDKWDFFEYDNHLYVRRSWTGALTHVAELEHSADAVVIRRIHCDRNTVFDEPSFAVAQLHFLITTHLFGTLQPFPVLSDIPRAATKAIALMGFNSYGRLAQFGNLSQSTPTACRNRRCTEHATVKFLARLPRVKSFKGLFSEFRGCARYASGACSGKKHSLSHRHVSWAIFIP
jgi:hypothetical protein